jgi:DNA-directed RNA polymerase specialized sigma24 family protein
LGFDFHNAHLQRAARYRRLSTEETAEALGLTEGATKVRLHRARLALRERLSVYFSERLPREGTTS